MFSLTTTFNRDDFTRLLTHASSPCRQQQVSAFFDTARGMNFYDDQSTTVGQLFEQFFPGREDVIRLLMEPITYANGSTLEDPAITYGIVFSNFMSKGVFTFEGGHRSADQADARGTGTQRRRRAHPLRRASKFWSIASGASPACASTAARSKRRAVVSNANLKTTIFELVGRSSTSIGSLSTKPSRAAEQFQHAGLHGIQAGRDDRSRPAAICCSVPPRRCSAPSCC